LITRILEKGLETNQQKTIFVLGKQALNPEHEAMGAMKSAYQFSSLSKLQVIGKKLSGTMPELNL